MQSSSAGRRSWLDSRRVVFGFVAGALVSSLGAACSSSKNSSVDGGLGFGGDDAGRDGGGTHPNDAGTGSTKDTGSPEKRDGACGSPAGSDWCEKNAPTPNATSYVLCDDFDDGVLSNTFNFPGVHPSNLVNTHYVSPYCALDTLPAGVDAGSVSGTYIENPYTDAPASAGATLSFDLYLPSGAACEGAVVARFIATASGSETDAIKLWLTLSSSMGASGSATAYTLTLHGDVGASADGGPGGTPAAPVSLNVTPRASDHGWVTLGLKLGAYAVATPATATATASWSYVGAKTAEGTSPVLTVSGQLVTPLETPTIVAFDVGVAPDPSTQTALTSCELYVDDVVSNLVITP